MFELSPEAAAEKLLHLHFTSDRAGCVLQQIILEDQICCKNLKTLGDRTIKNRKCQQTVSYVGIKPRKKLKQ